MTRVWRLGLAIAAAVATFFFTFWMGGAVLSIVGLPEWLIVGGAPVAALLVGRFALRRAGGLLREAAMGAVIVGTVGFLAGFFGPLILAPDANQGPLLGLLITGPLGALVGALGGAARWWLREGARARAARRRRAHPSLDVGQDASTAILSVHARWLAFEREGSPTRVLELCASDVVWRPPGAEPLRGRDAVRAWLGAQSPVVLDHLLVSDVQVAITGDTAVKTATFATRVRRPADGRVIDVRGRHRWGLRLDPSDGQWLVHDVAWTLEEGER